MIAPVKIPIEDILDLHTFRPREVPSLLGEYLRECRRIGIFSVRIIHGKGQGKLKRGVRKFLEKSPLVESVSDAPMEAGGWGATVVELRR